MDTAFVSEVTTAVTTALRNRMSAKQLKQRIPAFIAKQRGITVDAFHAKLNKESNTTLAMMVDVIYNSFSEVERAAIAKTF